MKFSIFIAFLCAILTLSNSTFANEDHSSERVTHYDIEKPASTDDAKKLLANKTLEVEKILSSQDKLDSTQLEKIHEISYSLEAGIDKLIDADSENSSLRDIDEAVQALHYASEEHKEDVTREWAAELKKRIKLVDSKNVADGPKKLKYEIRIKDHKFSPETVRVPAGEKIRLKVINEDPTPEEFESHDLKREKIISGKSKAVISIGPLKPGKYHFFGEFNMDSANGYVIAE